MLSSFENGLPSLAWWLQVDTANPTCIYYFGPFGSKEEAESSKNMYFDDLRQENDTILYSQAKFCQPRALTISEDRLHVTDFQGASLQLFLNFIQDKGAVISS